MCGTGRRLVAVARRFGPSVAYVGQDPGRSRVDAAARALADAGAGGVELVVGSPATDDALARFRRSADTVVCMPPTKSSWLTDDASPGLPWEFGPPSQLDSHLAWLQICYGYLRPGGTAVVPVSSSPHRRQRPVIRCPRAVTSSYGAGRTRPPYVCFGPFRRVGVGVGVGDGLGVGLGVTEGLAVGVAVGFGGLAMSPATSDRTAGS